MTSIKLAYMPQDSSLISPYLAENNVRGKNKGSFWGNPPAIGAPQAANAPVASSVWGSPLSVLNNNAGSATSSNANNAPGSFLQPAAHHQSLAALAANSEPVLSNDNTLLPPANAMTSPSFTQQALSSSSSQFSSRQNSHSETPSPVLGANSVLGSPAGSTAPNTPTLAAQKMPSSQMASVQLGAPSLSESSATDEIINTAIVVKNIPFAIKKEQLIDFMTQLGLPLPYAFNYHFDNGVFRGLAFANFASAEETAAVISSLNGRELGGRKLRVEYKKMLPYQERERIEREKRERRGQLEEQHQKTEPSQASSQASSASNASEHSNQHSRPLSNNSVNGAPLAGTLSSLGHVDTMPLLAARNPSRGSNAGVAPSLYSGLGLGHIPVDMNDPETLETYSSLLIFKRDSTRSELVIPAPQIPQLSSNQIAILGALCEKLDLASTFNDEQSFVISKKADRNYPEGSEPYLSGLLRNAASPVSYLRPKNAVNSLQTVTMRQPAAPAAVHHPSFPNIANQNAVAAAHNNGLQRWNSVGNVSGGNVGGGFAK